MHIWQCFPSWIWRSAEIELNKYWKHFFAHIASDWALTIFASKNVSGGCDRRKSLKFWQACFMNGKMDLTYWTWHGNIHRGSAVVLNSTKPTLAVVKIGTKQCRPRFHFGKSCDKNGLNASKASNRSVTCESLTAKWLKSLMSTSLMRSGSRRSTAGDVNL